MVDWHTLLIAEKAFHAKDVISTPEIGLLTYRYRQVKIFELLHSDWLISTENPTREIARQALGQT